MQIDVLSAVSGAPRSARTRDLLRAAARLVPPPISRAGDRPLEISVLFCGDGRMRALNRRFRAKDRPTDVLAFPGEGRSLGDIVISVPCAGRQARRHGEPRARELDRLLLHGYLHLLGYDHETDDGEMDELQSRLRRDLGIGGVEDRGTLASRAQVGRGRS